MPKSFSPINAGEASSLSLKLRHRFRRAADQMKLRGVEQITDELFERTFGQSTGHEAASWRNNQLAPGYLPLEVSFSERQASLLRFDIEPFPRGCSPAWRCRQAVSLLKQWILGRWGMDGLSALSTLDEIVKYEHPETARYGAFLGATFGDTGLHEAKIYVECSRQQFLHLPGISPELVAAETIARETFPGLDPLLTSLSIRGRQFGKRMYFICRLEMRLLDLAWLSSTLGLSYRLPQLIETVVMLTGGSFLVPPGSAVLSLREDALSPADFKLELLVNRLGIARDQLAERLKQCLRERSDVYDRYRAWLDAWNLTEARAAEDMTVISLRCHQQQASQIGIYIGLQPGF